MEELDDYSNIEYVLKLINVGLINQFLCDDSIIESDIKSIKIIEDETQFLRDALIDTDTVPFNFRLTDDSEILFSHDFKIISILKDGVKLFEVEKTHSEIFYDLLVELECNGSISISRTYSPEIFSWLNILKEEKVLVER